MVDLEGKALVLPADDVVFAVFQDLAYVSLLPVGVSLLSPYIEPRSSRASALLLPECSNWQDNLFSSLSF